MYSTHTERGTRPTHFELTKPIRARDQDIDTYVEQRIHLNEKLSHHCLNDGKLEEQIRRKVVEKAAGMHIVYQG